MNLVLCDYLRRMLLVVILATPAAYARDADIIIEVNGKLSEDFSEVSRIVERRFDSLKPGFFDSVNAQVHDERIHLNFSGWYPSEVQVNYMLTTLGRFKVSTESDPAITLIVADDIKDARPLIDRDNPAIALQLHESSAQRLSALTQLMESMMIAVEWEGDQIMRLQITKPLSTSIALSARSEEEALLMSAILRGGPLPDGTELSWNHQ